MSVFDIALRIVVAVWVWRAIKLMCSAFLR